MFCHAMLLKRFKGIFKDGHHESLLGQDERLIAATAEKLFHQERIGRTMRPAIFTGATLFLGTRRRRGSWFHASAP
jgi:hypothetical protein